MQFVQLSCKALTKSEQKKQSRAGGEREKVTYIKEAHENKTQHILARLDPVFLSSTTSKLDSAIWMPSID